MLANELKDLVGSIQDLKAELQHVEVKAAHEGCPKKLYDTLSAFSNQEGGGLVVFGLDEDQDFSVVGVYDAQDLQQQVNEQCKQMQPVVRPLFTMAEIDGQVVVVAEIPEIDAAEKPCYYRGTGRIRGSYIRVGDADEPMSEYEIYSFEVFRSKHQDDVRTVERATLASLDADSLSNYIHVLKQKKPNLAQIDDDHIRELLSITRDGVPTLATVMLFAPFPQAYFPQYGITAVVIPGYEMGDQVEEDVRFLDNRRIEGSIPQMLDEALAFVQKNMSVRTIVDAGTGKRRDRPEYPVKAVREAVLNALLHRDYSVHTEGTPVQIIFYKDRLEIHNPGGLYGRLTISQLGRVHADTRNPVIANMLEAMSIAENRYSGIPTIRREMNEAGLPPPEFFNERGSFRVEFYNGEPRKGAGTSAGEEKVIEGLIRFCSIPRSRDEIAGFIGLQTSYYAMQRFVVPLVEKGLLSMTIPEKPRSRNQKYVSVPDQKRE